MLRKLPYTYEVTKPAASGKGAELTKDLDLQPSCDFTTFLASRLCLSLSGRTRCSKSKTLIPSGIEEPVCNLFDSSVLSGAVCGKKEILFLTTDHTDFTACKHKVTATASLEARAYDPQHGDVQLVALSPSAGL